MKLITPVNILESRFKITHQDSIMLMGSCFSQNIGDKLSYYKFKTNPNCFGTVFNPISIANNLTRLIEEELYKEADFYNFEDKKLVNFNNQFSSFDLNLDKVLDSENKGLKEEVNHIKNAKTLIITLIASSM